eukprot:3608438-Pleurochrysis_carterae.AAC.1
MDMMEYPPTTGTGATPSFPWPHRRCCRGLRATISIAISRIGDNNEPQPSHLAAAAAVAAAAVPATAAAAAAALAVGP